MTNVADRDLAELGRRDRSQPPGGYRYFEIMPGSLSCGGSKYRFCAARTARFTSPSPTGPPPLASALQLPSESHRGREGEAVEQRVGFGSIERRSGRAAWGRPRRG